MNQFEESVTRSIATLTTLVEGIKNESLPALHLKANEIHVYVKAVNGRVGKLEKRELVREVLIRITKTVVLALIIPAVLILYEAYIDPYV